MRTHTLVGTGLTALLLGGFAAGGMTVAAERDVAKQATAAAGKASKALGKRDAAHAIVFAETAVSLSPRDPAYRMLLGQSYLKAGRFVSAGQAFADVLALSDADGALVGKAALNLALAQIAQGQWDVARTTLMEHADAIPARDRGLALALAGDPNAGVELLIAAARTPDADARTRQNLALTLALSGRWADARTVLAADMTPQDANARMAAWFEFAQPTAASDQVARLLGVTAVKDDGQPVALALVAPTPAETAPVALAAADEPSPAPATIEPVSVPVEVAQAAPAATPAPRIVFAERREVVQPLPIEAARPARMIAARGAFKTKVVVAAARKAPAKGKWFVQLGAFYNAGVARDGWSHATRRFAALSAQAPAGMSVQGRNRSYYRLSVGGFARADAAALCRGYRAKGGNCFVRSGAGDQVAHWVRPAKVQTATVMVRAKPRVAAGIQVASR